MNKEYHVAVTGCDFAEGTKEHPFRTISRAAEVAETGDKVIVHEGEYREWVKPNHSGYSNLSRITYEAAEGEKVVIKGSERIQNWENVGGTVWKVVLSNSFFGDFNPYKEILTGDWLIYTPGIYLHLGEVYLNGVSFYEAHSLEEVKNPTKRTGVVVIPWTGKFEKILQPEQTIYQWYCEVDNENTTIYANFHGADPNKELVEINVRKCCFYPVKTGMNYITVRGFEMAHAACPWTPPTADQPGLLGANWSKGWIIENNIIHDAKCSAISIGKEASTGHNLSSRRHQKPGYQYQMEAVFRALKIGWSKEKIGSHIIRNNVIYDCGQNGIVGHMGCAFSEIYNNHIYNIAVKHEFFGYEIAGIKLHAPIDVKIHHNRIHNCTLGTWLDWQAQGVRVSNNLYYNNDRDLMVEVSHGPYLVDNNIFASDYSFDNFSQGGAYVNNLSCGKMYLTKVLDRATPYHFPHTTEVAGAAIVYGGDDRFYNNIFVGGEGIENCGTAGFNANPASYEEYIAQVLSLGVGDHEVFNKVEQPVYIAANAYLNGAEGYKCEKNSYTNKSFNPNVKIIEEGNEVYIELNVNKELLDIPSKIVSTETLGTVRIVDAIFDDPNGNPIVIDTDYTGAARTEKAVVGPFQELKEGFNRIKVWG
ncbi:right-handed parallel beta-helix repeat-containing protein [Ruminiclostridium herbifermentans]|uniref:Right-handed parallel beta-helix repeat-containing protein n=1 Tax=Ruminiclostridium herbifermentans TaxID=2488810 RepID=A0A4U7JLS2_9FIRM|nr:right-handed parallel beta-helix repeat-containing protein [Ruminiclostridium herbifermentans]QNU68147.1 right-handed parallel beta-helix repeat-containing protein [Ruminiclostridium herbifermentans]